MRGEGTRACGDRDYRKECCCRVCVATTWLICGASPGGSASGPGDWPYWRGPAADGMAVGDAPLPGAPPRTSGGRRTSRASGTRAPSSGATTSSSRRPSRPARRRRPRAAGASPRRTGEAAARARGGGGPQVEHKFDVLALDRKTGKILWQRTAKTAVPHEGGHNTYGSFASNSPVTDGKYVYAFFGSRGMYCYDFKGNADLGEGLRRADADEDGVRRRAWRRCSPATSSSWCSITKATRSWSVLDKTHRQGHLAGRPRREDQLGRAARHHRRHAHRGHRGGQQQDAQLRPRDRQGDLGSAPASGANTIPQPVRQDDLVFVMTGYRNPMLMAIRLGREGDLTGTDAIVWTQTKGNSYTPSPVIFDNKLYVLTDTGMVSCYNAKTGEPYYHQIRLPKTYSFKSSPVGANGKLYLATRERRRGRPEDGRDVRSPGHQHDDGPGVHRHARRLPAANSSSGARRRCSASGRKLSRTAQGERPCRTRLPRSGWRLPQPQPPR